MSLLQPSPTIVLIGGGIMSATLGVLLNRLMPSSRIFIYERLSQVAEESSDAWNNAGTGHSAFCELNYTPERAEGRIDCSKAIQIAEQFEISKQLWAYLVRNGMLGEPGTFINKVAHHSFVQTPADIQFLRKRWEAMRVHPLFEGMEYTESPATLHEWFPLMLEGRSGDQLMAATRMQAGTDVNFGELTEQLLDYLQEQGARVFLEHEVRDIDRNSNGGWDLEIKDLRDDLRVSIQADFVFVGAGGGALRLLNKAGIDEIDGYGGFPVGGKWLRCVNEEVIARHHAKVYGKADIGAPPMSVPHLDTRIIDGKKEMLFGPYAGFSTKFLKHGSYWDLPGSLDFDNVFPMIQVGFDNIPLTRYLIEQVRMSFDEKMQALRKFYPNARGVDWEMVEAGQRVQVIKKDDRGEGVLEFGTELIYTKDGTLAGLLGASPGASTAAAIMLNLLAKCFPEQLAAADWKDKLTEMIPSYGQLLNENRQLLSRVRQETEEVLKLN